MSTWLDDIITTLEELGGSGSYPEIYEKIRTVRKKPFPKTWDAIIRRVIETHSSDSNNYKGKDIFKSMQGIGSGVWGIRDFKVRK